MLLLGISVFMLMADACLPEGSMKKYARFVLGLVLMAAILSPLWDMLGPLGAAGHSPPQVVETVAPRSMGDYIDYYKKLVLPDWHNGD